jgi:hypothetical protein
MDERLLIFGASTGGERVLAALPSGTQVVGFLDNDAKKAGTKFHGLPVHTPAELAKLEYDSILIASMSAFDIYSQLVAGGVPPERLRAADEATLLGQGTRSAGPGRAALRLVFGLALLAVAWWWYFSRR